MLKIAKTEELSCSLIKPVTRISNSLGRHSGYKFSDKKAKSNLLKGAAREPFEIFQRQICTMLFFSVGSYLEAVFPSISKWKNENKNFQVENLSVNMEDVLPGYDGDGKHMDTLVTFTVNGHKIVVTCFNTTQKIKVEGFGYFEFFQKYLRQLFCEMIQKAGPKIEDYNKGVIAALSGKRKAVTRPIRSVRYKATAKVSCNRCDVSFTNNSMLNVHKKSRHNRSSLGDSPNSSRIPIIDDLSILDMSTPDANHQMLELEESCPEQFKTLKCDQCDYHCETEQEIDLHKKTVHSIKEQIVKKNEGTNSKNIPSPSKATKQRENTKITCEECTYECQTLDQLERRTCGTMCKGI